MINFKKLKRCLIVAEISANHGQSFKRAISMIRKAKSCGVDAVKFQAYTPDTLTLDSNKRYFRIKHPRWKNQTLYQLYKQAYTPWKWFKRLKEASETEGLLFFATSFDKSSVDFLEELNVPLHKISSFELVDLPLIEYAAKTKKPLIMSTGMASKKEITEAVNTARGAGAKNITLLNCVSAYPADPKDMNLITMSDMKRHFKCRVGFSDHSKGWLRALLAARLGASVIEKHFTLSRNIRTPDSFFSIEPDELEALVANIKYIEGEKNRMYSPSDTVNKREEETIVKLSREEIREAKGSIHYGLTDNEKASKVFRRSLFAVKDIKKGELFTEENVRSIRPAYGLSPGYLKSILGKPAKKNIKRATPLSKEFINFKRSHNNEIL